MTDCAADATDRFQRDCEGSMSAIEGLTEALCEWAAGRGAQARMLASVSLILDELFSNVVMHGYRLDGEGRVRVEACIGADGELRVTLIDQAPAFNPLLVPEPDTSLPIEERDIGGLGLLFVRRSADHLQYERTEGPAPENRLTFCKRPIGR